MNCLTELSKSEEPLLYNAFIINDHGLDQGRPIFFLNGSNCKINFFIGPKSYLNINFFKSCNYSEFFNSKHIKVVK